MLYKGIGFVDDFSGGWYRHTSERNQLVYHGSARLGNGISHASHSLTLAFRSVARVTGGKLIPSDAKQAAEVSQWVNIADQEVRTMADASPFLSNRRTFSWLSRTVPSAA